MINQFKNISKVIKKIKYNNFDIKKYYNKERSNMNGIINIF